MKDEYREGIVKENMQRARKDYVGLKPGFNRGEFYAENFNRCWRAFDAFICSEFPNNQVGKRIEAFVKQFESWYKTNYPDGLSSRFRESIDIMSRYEIIDMTPHSKRKPVTISNKDNLKEVIDVIYRIRCNLEHGGKQMTEDKNIILVENGFYLLYEILEKILVKESVNF